MNLYRKKLECGATLIGQRVREQPVAIGVLIPYGAGYDPPFFQGRAHFLEHMLFKARTNNQRGKIEKELDAIGGDINAYTNSICTVVHCTVPQGDESQGARFVSDLVREPQLHGKAFKLEREVVFREIDRAYNDCEDAGEDLLHLALYEPPFGRPVRGGRRSLENITPKDLYELWDNAYHPSRFTFAFSGDAEGKIIADTLNDSLANHKLLSSAPKPIPPLKIVPRAIPLFQKREGMKQMHLHMGFHSPFLTDPEYFAFEILDNHLVGGFFSRLFQEIREKRGLAYRVESVEDVGKKYGSYSFSVGTLPRKVSNVLKIIRDEIEASTRLSEKDFLYAQKRHLGSILTNPLSSEDRMNNLLEWETYGLGAENYLQRDKLIRKASLEEARSVAERFHQQNPALVFIGPPDSITKCRAEYG